MPDATPLGRGSTATELIDLVDAAGATFFHSPDREAFVALPIETHRETWPVWSLPFRFWLQKKYYDKTHTVPNDRALSDAIGTMEGRAWFDGDERRVHVRLARYGENLYLDLANLSWQVVEITPNGWSVIDRSPVPFRRPGGMYALPTPERGGQLDELRAVINVTDDGWTLIIGWLVGALCPDHPFPVLELQGEPGSGKSTQGRMLQDLIDPSQAGLRALPHNEEDLIIAASNAWIVGFDNASTLPVWLSDALCRLSTGAALGRRRLYSNAEEFIFQAKRPVMMTTIAELIVRGDLADRAIP